jgi:hypothetical protein
MPFDVKEFDSIVQTFYEGKNNAEVSMKNI